MLINKVLETTIDLLDPNEMYQPDINAILIKYLKARYVKRCYQSMLILDVLKVLNRSNIKMSDNKLDGSAYVDVQFEVQGVVLIAGEILHGCEIIEIHSNAITAKHEYAGIKLQKTANDQISKILRAGNKIPVIIQKVRYNPNQTSITAVAVPYTPEMQENIYYQIVEGLNPSDTDKLDSMLEKVKEEEALHEKISKEKAYEFFKDLLYPFKMNQKYEQSKIASKLKLKPVTLTDVKSLLNINSGTVIYPVEEHRHTKRLYYSKQEMKDSNDGKVIVETALYPVIADSINKYYLYLQALRGFMETYPTLDKMQELANYWKICKIMQA